MQRKVISPLERYIKQYNGKLPTEKDPDYLEILNMSKYRNLNAPDVKSAKCANCGSAKIDGRRYIDFGLDIDWYGTVFLCSTCIKDIAEDIGLFVEFRDQLEDLKRELTDLPTIEDGEELYQRLVLTLTEFRNVFTGLQNSISNSGINNTNSDSTDSVSDSISDKTSASGSIPDSTKSRTFKSSASSGRQDIRSFTELLESGNTESDLSTEG